MTQKTQNITHPIANITLMRRIAAMFYDSLIVFALLFFATVFVLPFTAGHVITPGTTWFSLYLILVIYSYFVASWVRGGQTIGMRSFKFKVVDIKGNPLNIWQASLRFGIAIPALLLAGAGIWMSVFHRDGLTWQDQFSHTRLRTHL